jgi:hypothetical protein
MAGIHYDDEDIKNAVMAIVGDASDDEDIFVIDDIADYTISSSYDSFFADGYQFGLSRPEDTYVTSFDSDRLDRVWYFAGSKEEVLGKLRLIQSQAKNARALGNISQHLGPEESLIARIANNLCD